MFKCFFFCYFILCLMQEPADMFERKMVSFSVVVPELTCLYLHEHDYDVLAFLREALRQRAPPGADSVPVLQPCVSQLARAGRRPQLRLQDIGARPAKRVGDGAQPVE